HQSVRLELLDWIHEKVAALNKHNFAVKMVMRTVEKFCVRSKWDVLTIDDVHCINRDLANLIFIPEEDEKAKRFDGLMRSLQLSVTDRSGDSKRQVNKVRRIAEQLSRLLNIREVANAKELIKAATSDEFWIKTDYKKLELVRTSFRKLIQFIPEKEMVIFQTDFEDKILAAKDVEGADGYSKSDNYKLKVEKFIRENKNHIVIQKLRNNFKLTSAELYALEKLLFEESHLGTRQEFIKIYGEQPLGKFIRSILGLEEEAVQKAFSEFIDSGNLSAGQIQFVRTIFTHFKINGILELQQLAKPPFTDVNDNGIFGLFDDEEQDKIIRIVEDVNRNAVG
ncbi:MAG TPA: type I restriction-modification enzyme R subunit C-terminal domain-containing protein, partial [Prolixibacteraceae bacterium]|nr:type I restriction-modification enzyme R subunit C-terminal domain-containing protein [Prolixibacteraceae bacterium]